MGDRQAAFIRCLVADRHTAEAIEYAKMSCQQREGLEAVLNACLKYKNGPSDLMLAMEVRSTAHQFASPSGKVVVDALHHDTCVMPPTTHPHARMSFADMSRHRWQLTSSWTHIRIRHCWLLQAGSRISNRSKGCFSGQSKLVFAPLLSAMPQSTLPLSAVRER